MSTTRSGAITDLALPRVSGGWVRKLCLARLLPKDLNRLARLANTITTIICTVLLATVTSSIAAAEDGPRDVDVVLVLDTSGSMLLTDPLNLRQDGSRLFLSLLGKNDRVALVSFDETAQISMPFVPGGSVQQLDKTLSDLQTKGTYTDIALAIEQAGTLLKEAARPEAYKLIVLLSDGRLDPTPARGSPTSIAIGLLEGYLPSLSQENIQIHTLAFSSQADREFLEKVALKTGGLSWFTPTAEDIHHSFAELLLAAKRPQLVGTGGQEFFLDELVEEATFYINKPNENRVILTDGENKSYSSLNFEPNFRWFSTKKFEVITIVNPKAGTWTIRGGSALDGFVTVLTKLQLKSNWPSHVIKGQPTLLEIQLHDGDKPLSLTSMNRLVEYGFQISSSEVISEPILEATLQDDGKNGDRRSNDGVFSVLVALDELGSYRLKTFAKGPTFQREQVVPFSVRPNIVTLRLVEETADHDQGAHGDEHGASEHSPGKHRTDKHKPAKHSAAKHGEDEHSATEHSTNDLSTSDHSADHSKDSHSVDHDGNFRVFEVRIDQEGEKFVRRKVELVAVDEHGKAAKLEVHEVESGVFQASESQIKKAGTYLLRANFIGTRRKGGDLKATSKELNYVKEPAIAVVPTPEHKKDPEPEKKQPELPRPSVLPYALGLSAANLFLLGGYFLAIRSLRPRPVPKLNIPPLSPDLEVMVKAIEDRALLTEVNFSDPLYRLAEGAVRGAVLTAAAVEGREKSLGDTESSAQEEEVPVDSDDSSDIQEVPEIREDQDVQENEKEEEDA